MDRVPYTIDEDDPTHPPMGLVVLENDETLEGEFKHLFRDFPYPLYYTRVASGAEVTPESLGEMEKHLSQAATLLPKARPYSVIGYACTSGSAIIGPDTVKTIVKQACPADEVTTPLHAAIAYAKHLNLSRLAVLSPYVEAVNIPVLEAFKAAGFEITSFASFEEKVESTVARISPQSISNAAHTLLQNPMVDGVFISCTNLKTLTVVTGHEDQTGKPVFSSNSALAWHMKNLAQRS